MKRQNPPTRHELINGFTVEKFASAIDVKFVEAALASTGTLSVRRRKFPAEVAVWLVLGMGLFSDRCIKQVVFHLGLSLDGSPVAPSVMSQARERLGAEPIEALFRMMARAWRDELDVERYHGLQLFAVDGSFLRIQDSDENYEYFGKARGKHGEAAYPQVHIATLLDVSQRMIVDANFGPYLESELALVQPFIDQIPSHSLTIMDRGFNAYVLLSGILDEKRERHFMVRLRADVKPELLSLLPDGSWLARWVADKDIRREHPAISAEIRGRVIEYQHVDGEKSRLFVSLVDDQLFPAEELVELYHDRWEVELMFDELKTDLLERRECLRSKRPDGVKQELWGIFLAYNLVRFEMARAAKEFDLRPRCMSFRNSLWVIRMFFQTTAWIAPGTQLPARLFELREQQRLVTLPDRRPERRYERHVKLKQSPYKANRGTRSATTSATLN